MFLYLLVLLNSALILASLCWLHPQAAWGPDGCSCPQPPIWPSQPSEEAGEGCSQKDSEELGGAFSAAAPSWVCSLLSGSDRAPGSWLKPGGWGRGLALQQPISSNLGLSSTFHGFRVGWGVVVVTLHSRDSTRKVEGQTGPGRGSTLDIYQNGPRTFPSTQVNTFLGRRFPNMEPFFYSWSTLCEPFFEYLLVFWSAKICFEPLAHIHECNLSVLQEAFLIVEVNRVERFWAVKVT